MTGTKPTGVGVGVGTFPKSTTTLKPPSLIAYAPYFENVHCRGLYPNIIVLEWLQHKLNYFQLG